MHQSVAAVVKDDDDDNKDDQDDDDDYHDHGDDDDDDNNDDNDGNEDEDEEEDYSFIVHVLITVQHTSTFRLDLLISTENCNKVSPTSICQSPIW